VGGGARCQLVCSGRGRGRGAILVEAHAAAGQIRAAAGEQKQHDWSGFHMGVNVGAGFDANKRNSAVPGSFVFPDNSKLS
jgi:hypothetical protein